MMSGRPLPRLRRRHVLGLLTAGAALASGRRAAAMDMPAELRQPAVMTPAAAFGLFNHVAIAGPRLVAVGERGRILLSGDAGRSWRQAPAPVSTNLVTVKFATPLLGWATGQMGVILKTEDGGENWKLVMDGFQAANLMLAEAKSAAPAKPAGSDDGTAQTPLQAAQLLVSFGASNPFLSLVVLSPGHILAFGAFGLALESLDAGATWRGIGLRVQDTQGLHIYGALDTGDTLVLVGEGGLVLHGPADGTLTAGTSPYQGSLFGLVIASAGNAIAYGLQGTVLRSPDLGATWQSLPPVSANAVLCGEVLQGGRIVLGDASGNLLVSDNAGATFTTIPGTLPVTALAQAQDGVLILGSPAGLRRAALGVSS